MRRWIWSAVVFGAAWLAWALLLAFVASNGGALSRVLGTLPGVPGVFYGWPVGWALLGAVLTVMLAVSAYLALGGLLSRQEKPTFAVAWLAAILAGFVVGFTLDLVDVVRGIGMFGLRGVLIEPYDTLASTFWAVCAGWIPALVASRARPASGARDARRTATMILSATVALALALIAVVLGGDGAAEGQRAQAAQQQAEAEKSAVGLLPDPDAPGEPVPARAESSDPVPPDACTPENSMLLIGTSDAATGHRGQTIQLMNFSDQPCVVEGYPDIAFGDQNAHELNVTVEHGGSFMAQDPGPLRIDLPPQGTATATIGWDANSTHGALVTHTLHAAIRAGEERGSWPVILDIIEGSTVAVTAWG